MPLVGFETAISAFEREKIPVFHALDRAVTVIGDALYYTKKRTHKLK
jgi:acyl-CoA synthetase (NDP forming)